MVLQGLQIQENLHCIPVLNYVMLLGEPEDFTCPAVERRTGNTPRRAKARAPAGAGGASIPSIETYPRVLWCTGREMVLQREPRPKPQEEPRPDLQRGPKTQRYVHLQQIYTSCIVQELKGSSNANARSEALSRAERPSMPFLWRSQRKIYTPREVEY